MWKFLVSRLRRLEVKSISLNNNLRRNFRGLIMQFGSKCPTFGAETLEVVSCSVYAWILEVGIR